MSIEESHTVVGSASGTGTVRVLIVEDNPHIVEMYSYVLQKLASRGPQVEVSFADDGYRAMSLLRESHFDLVMTDLYMPGMDGFELLQRIRSDEALKHTPVVAISAGGVDTRERAMRLGVDVYLRKPVRFADVMDTVKQLLHIK